MINVTVHFTMIFKTLTGVVYEFVLIDDNFDNKNYLNARLDVFNNYEDIKVSIMSQKYFEFNIMSKINHTGRIKSKDNHNNENYVFLHMNNNFEMINLLDW